MKKLFLLSILFLALLASCNQDVVEKNPFAIIAYYVPEKDFDASTLPLHQLTHIIFSFSKVVDGTLQFRNESHGPKLHALVKERAKYPNLKVMIACGGWGSRGFSDMASTAENRTAFVKSAIDFIKEYNIDGLDMDWEYPTIPSVGTKARPEDKQNFTLLMRELRTEMDKLDRTQTLSFAAAGWKAYYDYIEVEEINKVVDFYNVMTYDLVIAAFPFTGHHTALGWIKEKDIKDHPIAAFLDPSKKDMAGSDASWEVHSVEKTFDYCINLGIPREKLVVGSAFYGRAWKGVAPANNGLYQANKGAYIGWCNYRKIRADFEYKNGFVRYWDPIAKAPYLYNEKDSIFISYDDPESVALKTMYAKDQKLGGIMFWELGNDCKEEPGLLDAIFETASKS